MGQLRAQLELLHQNKTLYRAPDPDAEADADEACEEKNAETEESSVQSGAQHVCSEGTISAADT